MKAKINYLTGDATKPIGDGRKIIAHICNDKGGWGKGFVLAVSKRWKEPEVQYREWFKNNEAFDLGEIQVVIVEKGLSVANMIAQKGMGATNGVPPIRYEALKKCLEELYAVAKEQNASVHMPRIGCGLAGGKWDIVQEIINEKLTAKGVNVWIYDFKS